jgi:hypothetical protein
MLCLEKKVLVIRLFEKKPFVSVIVDREKARLYYQPKKLFINANVKEKSGMVAHLSIDHTYLIWSRHLEESESLWDELPEEEKTIWSFREHDERQPLIRDQNSRCNQGKSDEVDSRLSKYLRILVVGVHPPQSTGGYSSKKKHCTYVRVLSLLTKHGKARWIC